MTSVVWWGVTFLRPWALAFEVGLLVAGAVAGMLLARRQQRSRAMLAAMGGALGLALAMAVLWVAR